MLAIDPTLSWTASLTLALIFAASSAIKLLDFNEFRGAVENYRIVPEQLALPIATIVPIAELAGAIFLMSPRFHLVGATLLILLLAIFTAAIALNIWRGRLNIDCGCFGPAMRQTLSYNLVVRNAVLIMMCGAATVPRDARAMTALDSATIALGAATLVILYAAANYLLANAPALERIKQPALEIADA